MNKISPYEKLTGKKHDYSFLKSFGCLCYASTLQKDRHKFSPRAEPCIFLGYPSGIKGYKVLNIETCTVSVSRNVLFHETDFPFMKLESSSQPDSIFSKSILPLPVPVAIDSAIPVHVPLHSHASSSSALPSVPSSVPLDGGAVASGTTDTGLGRARPKRTDKAPTYLLDYHCSLISMDSSLNNHYVANIISSSSSEPLIHFHLFSPMITSPFLSKMLFLHVPLRQYLHLLSKP